MIQDIIHKKEILVIVDNKIENIICSIPLIKKLYTCFGKIDILTDNTKFPYLNFLGKMFINNIYTASDIQNKKVIIGRFDYVIRTSGSTAVIYGDLNNYIECKNFINMIDDNLEILSVFEKEFGMEENMPEPGLFFNSNSIIIPGNSNRSGGDAQKFKGQCAPISEVVFLPKDTEKNWEKFIPKVWSSETIMPESACKSLKYMGHADFIEKYLNKERLLAFFIVGHADLKHLAIEKSKNRSLMFYYVIIFMFKKVFRAVYSKLLLSLFNVTYSGVCYPSGIINVKNYFKIIKNIKNISEANDYIMNKEKTFNI
jgi:hypothetical protein